MPIKYSVYFKTRAKAMAELHASGMTLQQIGTMYGVTRERVRQMLSKIGVTREDGGKHIQTLGKLAKVKAALLEGSSLKAATRAVGCGRIRNLRTVLSEEQLVTYKTRMAANRIARFWSRVDRRGPDECWPYAGSINPKTSYGECRFIDPWGKSRAAHVAAFAYAGGVLIRGLVIMHTCDNRPCCNPAHLRQVTQKENVHDSMRKGRRPSVPIEVQRANQRERAKLLYRTDPEYRENCLRRWREYRQRRANRAATAPES